MDNEKQFARINKCLDNIKCQFGPYQFKFLVFIENEVPFLQISFEAPCNITGKMELQKCRKWELEYTMDATEITRTAYKACEAAFMHELQESFTFMDVDVYNPHVNIFDLVEMRQRELERNK